MKELGVTRKEEKRGERKFKGNEGDGMQRAGVTLSVGFARIRNRGEADRQGEERK